MERSLTRRISFSDEREEDTATQPEDPPSPTSGTASEQAGLVVSSFPAGYDPKTLEEERQNLKSAGSAHSEEYQALVKALGDEEPHARNGAGSSAEMPGADQAPQKVRRPSRATSSPALAVHTGSMKKSPLKVKPPYVAPLLDRRGFPKVRSNDRLQHSQEWNESHHLTGLENHLLPNKQRRYFTRPQTRAELLEDMGKSPDRNAKGILAKLELPDVASPKRPIVTADAGQPVLPQRHIFGGSMKDRDGAVRAWNDRWQNSMSRLNDQCHPDHRAYFVQKSIFEESPSQQYRRYLDQEIAHGVWQPIATKKAEMFGPMGGRLRGRSGTPVPFATP